MTNLAIIAAVVLISAWIVGWTLAAANANDTNRPTAFALRFGLAVLPLFIGGFGLLLPILLTLPNN